MTVDSFSPPEALAAHDGPSPALEVSLDIVRRGIKWAPLAILLCGAIWSWQGAASAAFSIVVVVANFLLSAWLLQVGGRISPVAMGGAALFGYLLRLGLIFLAVMLVKDASWVNLVALGVTLIVTHLGLLFWELHFVSGSMAYPGLKPGRT